MSHICLGHVIRMNESRNPKDTTVHELARNTNFKLQHAATRCNTLRHTAHELARNRNLALQQTATHCTMLHHAATHSQNTAIQIIASDARRLHQPCNNTLQHTLENTIQHTATYYNTSCMRSQQTKATSSAMYGLATQCIATTLCNTLQHTKHELAANKSDFISHVSSHCNTLQHTLQHALQHTETTIVTVEKCERSCNKSDFISHVR